MSTRYVWSKYSTKEAVVGWGEKETRSVIGSYSTSRVSGRPTTGWVGCTETPILGSDGYFRPSGATKESGIWEGAEAIRQSTYQYFMLINSEENKRKYYYNLGSYAAQWVVSRRYSSDLDGFVELIYISDQTKKQGFNIVESVPETDTVIDSLIGDVSSAQSNTYPDNSISGSHWYIYQGSDNIDPISVSYSKQEPERGETITVSVAPRSNIYGGEIYYQYYYSINGGSTWTAIGSKTADTSKEVTIPVTASQFMVRVQASDNTGFTSTDYVSGIDLSIAGMLAYIGVNGKAQSIGKIYVGIDGKARQVIKGYIGVNGKAQQFL